MTKKSIIIGGGFAGLAVATELSSSGYQVTLIEQRLQLGGRAFSFFDRNIGMELDNGQHILMGCNENILRFLRTIGAADKLTAQKNLCVDFIDSGRRIYRLHCPPLPAPFHAIWGVMRFNALGIGDRFKILTASKAVSAEDGSVSEWLSSLGQGRRSRETFWNILTYAIMNESPDKASASLFSAVLHKALLTERKGSQILLPSVPLGRLHANNAESYITRHGGIVEKGCAASCIIMEDDLVTGIRLRDGRVLRGDCYISTVPYYALKRLLPDNLQDKYSTFFSVINELKASPIISIHLLFDKGIIHSPFAAFINSPIQWIFNKESIFRDSRYRGLISLVISGAHHYLTWDKEKLVGLAIEELKRFIPEYGSARLLYSRIIKERSATFTPLPGISRYRPNQMTPIRNFYIAGDWTDTGLPSTIEGAVLSGYKCAEMILDRDTSYIFTHPTMP